MKKLLFFLLSILFYQCDSTNSQWTLIDQNQQATIYLPSTASGSIQLAVEDLVSDVKKITGKKLLIANDLSTISGPAIVIANLNDPDQANLIKEINPELDTLSGQWESFLVYREQTFENIDKPLLMVGSDERGTMFAIYHFIEKYLNVDPFYYWTGMEPEPKEKLVFDNIEIIADEPVFKYRGWFNNDEDLITEFFDSEGNRNIDYRYYGQVVHPELMSHILESLVRSRYNLTIPASFVDIMNPPERKLVEEAAKRGLFISQHHVEPVGVSGFTFKNYWEAKGKEPKYSYFSSKAEIEEVWEKYIAEWSQIPNVVWQVGLRGIADSPMWLEDANIPDTDSARGTLISQAMQRQVDLIKKYDKRPNPPMTTTLWAEGVTLKQAGHLDFPEGVTIVFADNNPGYIWLDDFYESKREPDTNYGVYFHHQLWGSGPHLVQGVAPAKAYEMFKIAYAHDSHHYALMNVSNVREFILGIEGSTSILTDLHSFNPNTYLQQWCEERFGPAGELAHQAYQYLFNSYQVAPKTETPFTLDGQLKSFGLSQLYEIQQMIKDPEAYWRNRQEIKEPHPWWHTQTYIFPGRFMYHDDYEAGVEKQLEVLAKADTLIAPIKQQLTGDTLHFFTMNYEAQFKIIYGLSQWCNQVIKANTAMQKENTKEALKHLQQADEAIALAKSGQALASQGKWQHWYRGDKKFNMPEVEQVTGETLQMLED